MEAVSIEQDMAQRALPGVRGSPLPRSRRSSAPSASLCTPPSAPPPAACSCRPRAVAAAEGWRDATVMQNLPSDGLVLAVKLAMAVNLCFMAPITLLPGFKATEEALGIDERSLPRRGALRLAILALVGAAALLLRLRGRDGAHRRHRRLLVLHHAAACHLHFCGAASTTGSPFSTGNRCSVQMVTFAGNSITLKD